MLLDIAAILGGFLILIWGADKFVTGASATARNLGISPLIIGLTIVGFGTSAPEILVSVISSSLGNPGLAIGNALGSNITNIALILGATAVLIPLNVNSDTVRRELPILLSAMLIALVLLQDGVLGRLDGIFLLSGLAVMIYMVVSLGLKTRRDDPLSGEFDDEIPSHMPMRTAIIWLIVGLAALLISSRALVWGAVNIATSFGVSDLIIGLTIVALGTSLPELAASIVSAKKGEHDIAIGNVIGSNMFNLLAVLGLPGVIHPGSFDPAVLTRDYPVMIGLTILLFAMAYGFRGPGRITRGEGSVLLLAFIGYQTVLYLSATGAM
ncbi:calcium/sodium antiporter [Solemya pervernicosa gill symbiont]|uniref:Calcium/sodium antiporter n=2 Tax=Gammaproteobacteria incertae sedis TaxID=118884 RepID=A0A1T2L735_9GAMM|nr:calcium/sodium antiporter [Candidatus Reidiella endopervernicosa]OOZ40870.1 calcium/sodium antiporter [Solemya pervernicosa gill symbiont]QKQ28199.1 calcium/sodium antiporter [Candidatus Reidiella endopervernicosa]